MKRKIAIIFLILLTLLLAVSAVSAAENVKVKIKINNESVENGKEANHIVNVTVLDESGDPIEGIKVKLKINNADFSEYGVDGGVTNNLGIAQFNFDFTWNHRPGDYPINATTEADLTYAAGSGSIYLKVLDPGKPKITIVSISKKTINLGQSTTIKVRLTDSTGTKNLDSEPIWLRAANSGSFTRTDKNGYASFKFVPASAGTKGLTFSFDGDKDWYGKTYSASLKQNIKVNPMPELVVTKIKRSGNYKYLITIANEGGLKSSTTYVKMWYKKGKKTKSKIVKVPGIKAGASKTITMKFFKFSTHKSKTKQVYVNYNKKSKELNYANNKANIRKYNYYKYKADLVITKIKRVNGAYQVSVKNIGTAKSGKFNMIMWYGTKNKMKKAVAFRINSISPGVTMTIHNIKYSLFAKYTKFVAVNYDKKIIESNYNNNIKSYKSK